MLLEGFGALARKDNRRLQTVCAIGYVLTSEKMFKILLYAVGRVRRFGTENQAKKKRHTLRIRSVIPGFVPGSVSKRQTLLARPSTSVRWKGLVKKDSLQGDVLSADQALLPARQPEV